MMLLAILFYICNPRWVSGALVHVLDYIQLAVFLHQQSLSQRSADTKVIYVNPSHITTYFQHTGAVPGKFKQRREPGPSW